MITATAACEICNGRKQTAPGVACPVCGGTGMSTPEQAAAHRRMLATAAVDAARRVVEAEADSSAREWVRGMNQSLTTAQEAATVARVAAGEARAHAERASAVAVAQAQVPLLAASRAEAAAQRAEAAASPLAAIAQAAALAPPDPTDPPPFAPIPAGFGAGDLQYMDGLLVRQLDVWGALNLAGGVTITGVLFATALAGPSTAQPTVFRAPDGTIIVLPLATYSIVGDDSVWINQAFTFAPGSGSTAPYLGGAASGVVQLLPNAVYSTTGSIVIPWGQSLWGGRNTVIAFAGGNAAGTSNAPGLAAIYAHGNATGNAVLQGQGTTIRNLLVDGGAVPGGNMATGIDAGDQYGLLLEDVIVQNFTTTATTTGAAGSNPQGSVGININNISTLTEKMNLRRVVIANCATGLQMVSTSGNSTSHMYGDVDVHFNQQVNQDGLVIAHNGNYMNGWCKLRGNFWNTPQTANSAAVIRLGVRAQAGHIQRMTWDVRVESDPTGSGGIQPTTIAFGSNADNQFLACLGTLVFLDGFQNAAPAVGNYQLRGTVIGDSTLATVATPALPGSGTPYVNVQGDAWVYISSANLTNVQINGVAIALYGTAGATVFLPMNQTIQLAYSGSTLWSWFSPVIG